ncbi:MAG TPA: hypothetical protein VFS94_04995 [Gemmatimonadales bacterium]|nr:hypothetical protein [Gemmatimonadales bacterium]
MRVLPITALAVLTLTAAACADKAETPAAEAPAAETPAAESPAVEVRTDNDTVSVGDSTVKVRVDVDD